MRKILGCLAVVLGAISIALTARYGWSQADDEIDRYIAATLFGAISLCAFVFDGLAVRLWSKRRRAAGIFVGLIAAFLFVVTLTNSLGGIASRADKVQAERQMVKDTKADDRRDLARLEKALVDLGKFTATDGAAVEAAKRAADTASSRRQAECGEKNKTRGPHCKDREDDESKAADLLATVSAARATTDRAQRLEDQIAAVKSRLGQTGSVAQANPLGNALALLIGSAADVLTARLQAIIALAFELCLVGIMVGFEALRHDEPPVATVLTPAPQPIALMAQPALPRPHLLAEDDGDEIDPTPVIRFMKERMRKETGAEADWADIFRALPEWWAKQRLPGDPPSPAELGAILRFISEETGIRTRKRGGKVYFIDRKVV